MAQESFIDRLIDRLDKLDSGSLQAYILRLFRDRGFFESVFNTIQEGILVIDRHLKLQYFNAAAKNMLGLPEDYGKVRIVQLLPQLEWRRILEQNVEAWTRLARQEIEIAYPTHRWLQVYLVPQQGRDGKGFATVILRDVTESRAKADAALESKTAQVVAMLAGSVAHEIGNPLNSLYLNLQLLRRSLADGGEFDRAEACETVAVCEKEVERLDNLIGQFLQAVRPGKPVFAPVDLRELMVGALHFMRREIELRKITVKCDWPEVLPLISGDAGQLKQAFYNILKNAVQAMNSGGSLTVTAESDADAVSLIFADSGHGVDSATLSRMFDPFESFRAGGGGSGLGMMIIERVMREHGASLLLDSKAGCGLTLSLRFPREGRRLRLLPGDGRGGEGEEGDILTVEAEERKE